MGNKNVFSLSAITSFLLAAMPASALFLDKDSSMASSIVNLLYTIFNVASGASDDMLILLVRLTLFALVFIFAYMILENVLPQDYKKGYAGASTIIISMIIAWATAVFIPQTEMLYIYVTYSSIMIASVFLVPAIVLLYINYVTLDKMFEGAEELIMMVRCVIYSAVILLLDVFAATLGKRSLEIAQSELGSEIYALIGTLVTYAEVLLLMALVWNVVLLFFMMIGLGGKGMGAAYKGLGKGLGALSDGSKAWNQKLNDFKATHDKIIQDKNLKKALDVLVKYIPLLQRMLKELAEIDEKKELSEIELIITRAKKVLSEAEAATVKVEKDITYYESLVSRGQVNNPEKIKEIEYAREQFDMYKQGITDIKLELDRLLKIIQTLIINLEAKQTDLKARVNDVLEEYTKTNTLLKDMSKITPFNKWCDSTGEKAFSSGQIQMTLYVSNFESALEEIRKNIAMARDLAKECNPKIEEKLYHLNGQMNLLSKNLEAFLANHLSLPLYKQGKDQKETSVLNKEIFDKASAEWNKTFGQGIFTQWGNNLAIQALKKFVNERIKLTAPLSK